MNQHFMELSKYEVSLWQEDAYWFVSKGKKGGIYKGVLFQALPEPNRYNLAMGDINLQTTEMEFDELSENGDVRKIFATVASVVMEYTAIYPEREIFVSGNTDDKKRSYSFMTSWYLDEIQADFEVWGAFNGQPFEPFKKDKVYFSILVKRK